VNTQRQCPAVSEKTLGAAISRSHIYFSATTADTISLAQMDMTRLPFGPIRVRDPQSPHARCSLAATSSPNDLRGGRVMSQR
jgi:hypothetical protein